ncbi:unnamed protein product [Effrenium voratum]|uniref:Uncharacterized protein n=1 Tax=Effrenium voratum TaxID=2562239 RepID=A0AA36IQF8_9DINO|nr:unnamed protein product [Effrenium voratum]CAJ1414247.1 unnamed protein product [Effrenium voratum]
MEPQLLLDACERGDACGVQAALLQGAKPGMSGTLGCAPLHLAVTVSGWDPPASVKIASILINARACIDARDGRSNTPLHYCAMYSQGGVWPGRLLLALGADPMLCNGDGQKPSDVVVLNPVGCKAADDFYVMCKCRESQILEEAGVARHTRHLPARAAPSTNLWRLY